MNVVEPILRHALANPEAIAVINGPRTISYRALMLRAQHFATQLQQQGVQRGEIVGTIADSFSAKLQLMLSLAWLGAASMPFITRGVVIAPSYGVKRIVYRMERGAPPEGPGVQLINFKSLREHNDRTPVELQQCEPDEIWRVALSSGTTGKPKAILFAHGPSMMRSQLLRAIYPGDEGQRLLVDMGPDLAFSVNYFLRTLQVGGTVVAGGAKPVATLEEIRRCGVTFLVTSTGNAINMADHAGKSGSAYAVAPPSLKTVVVGGSAVGAGLHAKLVQRLCPNLFVGYGASETGALAILDPALQARFPTCGGRILPWVEMEAVDEQGKPLPAGEKGALRTRTPALASRYLYAQGAAPESPPAFRDGWFYLGDQGIVTRDGTLFLMGRTSDVLNVGGNKVEPTVVEEVIERDEAITESAVLVMQRGDRPILVGLVVSAAPVDAQALRKRCLRVLGAPRTPTAFLQVPSLPRNVGGKLERDALARVAMAATPATDTI